MSVVPHSDSTQSSERRSWWKSFVLPAALMAAIGIILVPLPPLAMDLLLSLNLTLSVLILFVTIFVRKPLDFSSFPTVLLTAVMFRLSLNIASTRLILSRAEEFGTEAAGQVIQAFSEFVTAGNLVVGVILFLIILIIQFVVITKGAGRISEVSARFTLDGLPGKQMAIDAELQSGAISLEEAKRRREALGDEVDFYGAMDGASKFVRGDAVAGLGITFINVLGGIALGLTQGNHTLSETIEIYSRLTIGDGLVSQLPAFLTAIGAAVLVSRSNREKKLAEDVHQQLFSSAPVLALTGILLFLLALTPLPKLPLLILGTGCEILAFMLYSDSRKELEAQKAQQEMERQDQAQAEARKASEVRLEEAILREVIELEIGSSLVPWTEKGSEFDLLAEMQNIRRKLAREFGFLMPSVRVKLGDDLDAASYRIRIHGSPAAEYVLRLESLLAVEGIYAMESVEGLQTKEPVRKLPAVWISPKNRDAAEGAGYEIFTPGEVLIRHLHELAIQFAPELLTHDDVQNLLDEFAKTAPAAVRDVVPNLLTVQEIQGVLQRLLAERVPIRSLGSILEALGRAAERTHHPVELTEAARAALKRLIVSRNVDAEGILHVLTFTPALEAKITNAFELTEEDVSVFPDPLELNHVQRQVSVQIQRIEMLGQCAVLLVSPPIRPAVREMTKNLPAAPAVLSFEEVLPNVQLDQCAILDVPQQKDLPNG